MSANLQSMSKTASLILIAAASLGILSCTPGVDMPKGTSKGYTSARLVQRDPKRPAPTDATEKKINDMIQKSIAGEFTANGLAYGKGGADLTVAYMVIYQEPGMTARFEDYFGYGRDADSIGDLAHTRGALENENPNYFERAGILIDVIDSRSNKLVYRNFAKGDVVRNISDSTRASRINTIVSQALAPFFGKN